MMVSGSLQSVGKEVTGRGCLHVNVKAANLLVTTLLGVRMMPYKDIRRETR